LLIGDIAEVMARKEVKPSLAKKLHVLAALEVQENKRKENSEMREIRIQKAENSI